MEPGETMEQCRAHYAASSEVSDLWAVIQTLRDEIRTLNERIAGTEGHGAGSADAVGSGDPGVERSDAASG